MPSRSAASSRSGGSSRSTAPSRSTEPSRTGGSSRSTGPSRAGVLVLAVVLSVAGCGQAGSDRGGEPGGTATESSGASSGAPTAGTGRPQPTEPTVTPPPDTTDVPHGTTPEPGSAAEAAVDDLVNRLGVAREEVSVVRVDEVTWNDASLGCPKPGMLYAQVITPGSRILLRTGGRSYEYHAADGRAPILCEGPQLPSSASS